MSDTATTPATTPATNPATNPAPGALNNWRSIPALAERINEGCDTPTFTTHALRHYVRNAHRNGLAPHVRRINRKILVNEVGFLSWLDAGGQGAA